MAFLPLNPRSLVGPYPGGSSVKLAAAHHLLANNSSTFSELPPSLSDSPLSSFWNLKHQMGELSAADS